MDGTHFVTVFGLDRVGVVPEIESIDVAVVEPNSRVVRMIDTFAGPRRQRKSRELSVPSAAISGNNTGFLSELGQT